MENNLRSKFDSGIIFFLLSGTAFSFLFSLAALQVFAAALALLFFFEKKKSVSFDLIGKFILAFAAARLISIIFSEYPEVSVHALYKEALFFFSFFAFNYYFKVLDEINITYFLKILVGSAAVISLIGLFRFIINDVERAQSFTSGYMAFSVYLTVILVFYLFNFKTIIFTKNYNLVIKLFVFAVILSGIVTSLGRMNIAVSLLFAAIAFLSKKISFKNLTAAVIGTILISALSFTFNNRAFESRMEAPAALSDRDILYKGFVELYDENPLTGFGPRTFKEIFPFRDKFMDTGIGSWHNDYIEVYIESGILGLLTFLGIFGALFYSIFTFIKSCKLSAAEKNIEFGVVASIAALLITGLTSGFIKSPIISILAALLMALSQRKLFVKRKNNSDPEVLSP